MSGRHNGDWIQTYTGRKFWPLAPRAEDVCALDIAHALALKCRFGGHCNEFYSVAQHSVLVSEVVAQLGGDTRAQLAGLLHDAGEAYLPDVASPIKRHLYFCQGDIHAWEYLGFKRAEDLIIGAVYEGLELEGPSDADNALVKRADVVMLMTESRDVMSPAPEEWGTKAEFLAEKVVPVSWQQARIMFINRLKALTHGGGEASAVPDATSGSNGKNVPLTAVCDICDERCAAEATS